MPNRAFIELSPYDRIPILYEDRSILCIDKPVGWMLIPLSWQKTNRNLQAALLSSMAAGDFWARSRNLKFFKYIHRLDAETSGILLFAKTRGALRTFEDLFETRKMEKVYLCVATKTPKQDKWNCRASLAPDPKLIGRMRVDAAGKAAETDFRLIASRNGRSLIEARPYTGRTHQIRVHLLESGCPIVGDELYGRGGEAALGLRAIGLAYKDPFTRKPVMIRAPFEQFLRSYGFEGAAYNLQFESTGPKPSRPAAS
jgi:RluA family pseudouridine synthase